MSISKLQIGLSESRKPCLNLRSRRCLEPRRSLVRCLIPLMLKQIYVLLGEGLINCKILVFKSSVIRQKGETQTDDSRKQSTPNFPKNEHFLPPDTHDVRFSEQLACFVFLKHLFWDSPFSLITDVFRESYTKTDNP